MKLYTKTRRWIAIAIHLPTIYIFIRPIMLLWVQFEHGVAEPMGTADFDDGLQPGVHGG